MNRDNPQNMQPTPPFAEKNADTPEIGGGLPVIEYWAEHTLSPEGPKLWKTLLHKSACLSCSWGTGGQKGGFTNEEGEKLQRCMKSVEAISAEIKPAVPPEVFKQKTITELQKLTSMECDRLGRLSYPMILRAGSSHYERISWQEVYTIAKSIPLKSTSPKTKLWMPEQVLSTPNAIAEPWGQKILARVESLNLLVEILPRNRLTGLRGEDKTYQISKRTLAVVTAPISSLKLLYSSCDSYISFHI